MTRIARFPSSIPPPFPCGVHWRLLAFVFSSIPSCVLGGGESSLRLPLVSWCLGGDSSGQGTPDIPSSMPSDRDSFHCQHQLARSLRNINTQNPTDPLGRPLHAPLRRLLGHLPDALVRAPPDAPLRALPRDLLHAPVRALLRALVRDLLRAPVRDPPDALLRRPLDAPDRGPPDAPVRGPEDGPFCVRIGADNFLQHRRKAEALTPESIIDVPLNEFSAWSLHEVVGQG